MTDSTNTRNFLDLTDDEVKQIVTDMFDPKKITCINRHKRDDMITCKIYTEWKTTDDDGNTIPELFSDEITLRNPFDYGEDAIDSDFQIQRSDYTKLKQFCFAKGIYGAALDWLLNNPYTK